MKKASSNSILKRILACIAGVLALVPAACGSPASAETGACKPYVAVSRFPDGGELARLVLDRAGFSLSFIHSVSKTRVVDLYQVRGRDIVQTAERFRAHGAGLPSGADEPGGLSWETRGDEFVLRMERPIPRLVVRTDKNYENRLSSGGVTLNLNQWEDQALHLQVVCE